MNSPAQNWLLKETLYKENHILNKTRNCKACFTTSNMPQITQFEKRTSTTLHIFQRFLPEETFCQLVWEGKLKKGNACGKNTRERAREKTGNRFFPPWNFGGKIGVHSQSPVVSVRMSDKRTRRQFCSLKGHWTCPRTVLRKPSKSLLHVLDTDYITASFSPVWGRCMMLWREFVEVESCFWGQMWRECILILVNA